MACLVSEHPDFPVTPRLQLLDPYAVCLQALASSDYVVQILRNAYGQADIEHNGEHVSITHMEYRRAFELRTPVFSLVYQPLWDMWKRRDVDSATKAGVDPRLLALLDEMNNHRRRKWVTAIQDLTDAKTALDRSLFGFDDSKFNCDLGVPDGSNVPVDTVFDKGWCIENNGMTIWEERSLKEMNPTGTLFATNPCVPIPRTAPGELATVWVKLRTGKYPATNVLSTWKMVDRRGRLCFPDLKGVYCNIPSRTEPQHLHWPGEPVWT